MDENGRMVSDHSEKSTLFYQEFKRRFVVSVDTSMQFNLQNIVQPCHDLEALCDPFSTEEIDAVILDLPYDKAPGPDGFNNLFYKKLGPLLSMMSTVYVMTFTVIRLILKVSTLLTSLLSPRKTTLRLLMTLDLLLR